MTNLRAQLTEDMKNAMRAHDSVKLGVIRFLLSELKNWEIDHGPQDDNGIQQVIARELKKMKEAVEEFKKGDRQDLVDEEMPKIEIVQSYLPAALSDDELKAKVKAAIDALPDKNFGAAMKAAMAAVQGQADGGRVSALVKELLG
jgi:uncharacterized protein YqeY